MTIMLHRVARKIADYGFTAAIVEIGRAHV